MGGVHILDTKYSTILQSYCKVADFAFLTHSSGTLIGHYLDSAKTQIQIFLVGLYVYIYICIWVLAESR